MYLSTLLGSDDKLLQETKIDEKLHVCRHEIHHEFDDRIRIQNFLSISTEKSDTRVSDRYSYTAIQGETTGVYGD